MSVFQDLREMEQEMESLHHNLAELDPAGAEYAAASDRLHHIDSEFRNRDGYAIEAQVGTVLNGLGFRKGLAAADGEFSGGWQMRLALAKLLLEKPICSCWTSRPILDLKPATGWNRAGKLSNAP
jgi:ATP-binding cassette subfamily F protein 3